ncbi:hypothetical protein C8J55DRAFT_486424 [Lentinula edodes]|uniref:Uncharacterized protein n=1 Tax=Lentinula lateritia TaxID=40482 RepID=A0A9W9DZC2_9AGAR|nr:hypothetical protein C8J55DRAFT_486424 [Lentinula edodes]
MFLFLLSITSHYLLGIVNRNIHQDGHKTKFKFDKSGLDVHPSPARRETYQLLSSNYEYYELKIYVEQDDFDKLNYIYANQQANVENALHNHQMTHSNTIVVKPKFDAFGVPHSMKDLTFWLQSRFYRLLNGETLQIYVSVTPVEFDFFDPIQASATSQVVADWSKWKGGIKDLPPHLASNLQ